MIKMTKLLSFIFLSFIYCFIGGRSVFGQVLLPGTPDYDYYRLMLSLNESDSKPISFFPSIITDYAPDSAFTWNKWSEQFNHPQTPSNSFRWISPTVGSLVNTGVGHSYNDGPMWNGKGLNGFASAGFYGKLKVTDKSYVSYTFNPIVYFAQNKDYPIPAQEFNKSPYSYPFLERLDYVERYGGSSFARFNPGQSELKFVYSHFSAGVSTQNLNWGPSLFNPILLSSQAAGVPHIDLGLNKPVDIKIGYIDGKVILGLLEESDYYDFDPNNNYRYLTGIIGGYRPSFVKGLNIGIQRIMYRSWQKGDLKAKDVFASLLNTSPKYDEALGDYITNDVYDQLASLSLRWNRPELGLEMWGEYARNDFPGDLKEFLRNPDRSGALTIGVSEAFEIKNGHTIRLLFENTRLSANQLQIFNSFSSPMYYVHNILKHGNTNDGQYLGAGIGAGSNTHIFQAQYVHDNGMFGLSVQRIRFNDDYILTKWAGALRYPSEFELNYGAFYYRTLENISINAQLNFAHRYQWFYGEQGSVRNLQLGLSVRYLIPHK